MATNDKEKPGKYEIKSSAYNRSQTRKIPTLKRGQARVSVGRAERRLADPQPDPKEPDITGRYQEENGIVNFHVNQAGTHIECLLADVLTAKTQRSHKIIRFGGDLQKDGSFNLYAYPLSNEFNLQGSIHVEGDNLLVKFKKVIIESNTLRMIRKSTWPTPFEHALESAPPIAKAIEWHPLVDQQIALLEAALDPKILERKLRTFFLVDGLTVASRNRRNQLVDSFDKFIGQVFSTEPPDGIHPQDLPLFQLHALRILNEKRMEFDGSSRSFLTWISEMLTQVQPNTKGLIQSHAPNIRKHLGIDHEPNPKHKFKALITVVGLAGDFFLGLGGYVGELTIQRTTEPIWKQKYFIIFAGGSLGYSFGIRLGMQTSGEGESFEDWLPEDIPGHFFLGDGSATVAVGAEGPGSVGLSALYISGADKHTLPLIINLTGFGDVLAVVSGGVEVGASYGWIFTPSTLPSSKNFDTPLVITDYVVENQLHTKAHFHLGSALLTDEGRQALRVFCAAEQAPLIQPGSVLAINGYADRIDTKDRNLTLSALRAANAYQAIKDILGDKLKIPQERTDLLGLGEKEAEAAGEADHTKNPNFRRVDMILNNRMVIKLLGE